MVKHVCRQILLGLVLTGSVFLVFTFLVGISHAGFDFNTSATISGGKKYYEVDGITATSDFSLSVSTYQTLMMKLYDENGNLLKSGTSFSYYLGSSGTFYIEISIVSGSGSASYTITSHNVYSISYYGTKPPFNTGDLGDPINALTIGGPIVSIVGFAIIMIFGRMKVRQGKVEVPFGIPVQQPAPGSKKCPVCGLEVAPDSDRCLNCGNKMI